MSIEVRNLSKRFGSFSALRDVALKSVQGNYLHCSGHRVPEKLLYSALSPDWKRRMLDRCCFTARMQLTSMCASGRWVSYFSTMRYSEI